MLRPARWDDAWLEVEPGHQLLHPWGQLLGDEPLPFPGGERGQVGGAGEPPERLMNNEVYVWLGRELGEPALAALSDEVVIQISPGIFVHPSQAFWQPSQLGRWASELPHEMRRYQTFLDALGVTETPTAADLDFILKLIAEAVGTNQLEVEDELVVRECWAMLDLLLHSDPTTARTLQLIGRRPSYPDRRQVLARPERLIFRDPRRLVDQITLLVNEVIDRERRNQRALEAAGVTRAEDVIDVQPVDVVSETDSTMMRLLLDRRVPLMRAIHSVAVAREDLDFDPDRLVALDVHAASTLNVVYRASVGSQHFATPPQSIDAMYFDDTYRVVHTRSLNRIPVAREISRAVAPYLDPSELAPLIVSVLDADSVEDAMQRLDDYGVALVVDIERETIASSVAVDVLEGKAGDAPALSGGSTHGSGRDSFEDGFEEVEVVLDGEAEPGWVDDLRDQSADGGTSDPVGNVESEVASDHDLQTGASRRTSRSHEREGALGGGLGTRGPRRRGSKSVMSKP